MSVDRLTHIRHNWQEKGNGPRGRDVDFLFRKLDERQKREEGLLETVIWMSGASDFDPGRDAHEEWVRRRDSVVAEALAALPATEPAQPEEEPNG